MVIHLIMSIIVLIYCCLCIFLIVLNLKIINHSKGTKSLDDVMNYMYAKSDNGKAAGYSEEEFKKALELFCGENLDGFYAAYINGLSAIDFKAIADSAGLKLTDLNATKNEAYLGVNTSNTTGKLIVTSISNVSGAYVAGLNVNDEILAVDNYRIDDLVKATANKKPGESMDLLISRDGIIKTIHVTLTKNTGVKYKLEKLEQKTAAQEIAFKAWIK